MTKVTDGKLENLVKLATILRFNKRAIIVLDGQTPTMLHIIKDGIVKILKTSQAGKEFTIDIRYTGETTGLIPVIKGTPHFVLTRALAGTEVVAIRLIQIMDI